MDITTFPRSKDRGSVEGALPEAQLATEVNGFRGRKTAAPLKVTVQPS